MATKDEIISANFIMRDFLDNDCTTFMIGEVAMYFYTETLIGVRHEGDMTGLFIELPVDAEEIPLRPPAFESITDEHIQMCINDVDQTGETMTRTNSLDIVQTTAQALVMKEIAKKLNG